MRYQVERPVLHDGNTPPLEVVDADTALIDSSGTLVFYAGSDERLVHAFAPGNWVTVVLIPDPPASGDLYSAATQAASN